MDRSIFIGLAVDEEGRWTLPNNYPRAPDRAVMKTRRDVDVRGKVIITKNFKL